MIKKICYMSDINTNYIKRYLYDKFSYYFQKYKNKEWSYKVFFNCEKGVLEYFYSYFDKVYKEGINIMTTQVLEAIHPNQFLILA